MYNDSSKVARSFDRTFRCGDIWLDCAACATLLEEVLCSILNCSASISVFFMMQAIIFVFIESRVGVRLLSLRIWLGEPHPKQTSCVQCSGSCSSKYSTKFSFFGLQDSTSCFVPDSRMGYGHGLGNCTSNNFAVASTCCHLCRGDIYDVEHLVGAQYTCRNQLHEHYHAIFLLGV